MFTAGEGPVTCSEGTENYLLRVALQEWALFQCVHGCGVICGDSLAFFVVGCPGVAVWSLQLVFP